MSVCTEVGRWITENVEQPVERFFERWREECTETREWVEREVRTPITRWREEQQEQCRKEECWWLCLCCNKWVCTLVTVLVSFVEWVVQIIGEWVVETVCLLVAEIVRVIVMVIIKVTRWVVEAVVCIIEKFCAYLIFTIGVAIIGVLVALIAAVGALGVPGGMSALIAAAVVAVGGLLLAKIVCEIDQCRLLGILAWALKWAIVIGMVMSVATLSVGSGFIVVLYGGLVSMLIWTLLARGCQIPRMLGWP